MTTALPGDQPELAELRQQARQLVDELAGPLRRIHLRYGDAVLEIEWQGADAPAGAGPVTPAHPGPPPAVDGQVAENDVRQMVSAPLVGTYYRAAEPGGPPFVEVGDKVEPGQVIGIVEAMKLMNEVFADHGGRVVELLVSDGEPVEFGQPLIALVPA